MKIATQMCDACNVSPGFIYLRRSPDQSHACVDWMFYFIQLKTSLRSLYISSLSGMSPTLISAL